MLCSAFPPTATPSLANPVLHETVSAKTIVGFPLPHGTPVSLRREVWLPGNGYVPGPGMVEFSFATLPVLNAAEPTISLKLDPGGNVSLMARFSSGCAGSLRYFLSAALNLVPFCVARSFGLNVG